MQHSALIAHLPSAPPLTTLAPPPNRHAHSAMSSCALSDPRSSKVPPRGSAQLQISRSPESEATRRFCSSGSQRVSLIPAEVLVLLRKRFGHSRKCCMDLKTHRFPSHCLPVSEEHANAKLPSVQKIKENT